ncbi:MAG: UvrD-helicase domain-containing protein [Acidobacteriota bacterium]
MSGPDPINPIDRAERIHPIDPIDRAERTDPIDRAERDLARGSTAASRRGRWLVEASAGTGKTSVLIDRALAYVQAGERRITELAIITFTEAAAAELKMRLRAGIGGALAAAEGDERARWVEALGDLESAPIGTIHAFCVELLRLRPVEAGLDPNFSVADELARKLLFAEVWDEWLRAGDIPDEAFEAALDLGFDGEAELRQAAERLAEIEPEALPKPWFKEADLLVSWERAYALAQSGLRACDPKGSLSGKFQAALKTMDEWRGLPSRQWQRKLIARELKISTQAGKKEFEQRAIQARGEINELLALLRERLVHLRLCEFSAWLATAGEAYRERAARSGRVDFDEQLRRARKLLHDVPAVRAEFRRRYPVVMVDEFQDTDRLQTEIVLMLAEPGDEKGGHEAPRSLFLVGDPKQSIYRFRGADLESYNRLVLAEVPEDRRLTLRQSFRPLPALAEAVNQAMAKVMAPPAGQVLAAYETAYRDLAALEPPVTPRGGGIVDLQLAPFDGGRTSDARAAEAEALARFAFAAVAGGEVEVRDRASAGTGVRPARYGDVALLLSKMTELQAYEEAFNRSGVPFRVLGGRHYYRRDEVHALLEILRALADPGDAGAVVAALRGPAFGVSDADLLAYSLAGGRPRLDGVWVASAARLAESPDPAAAVRCGEALHALVDLREAVIALPLADLVAEVIERAGLLPYFALQHRGEQRVANLHKAIDVARRIEAAGRRDLQSFMRWMAGLLEDEPEESDSPYLEGEGDAVRVTTVHRAKGLEYPIVMLGGIVGGTAPDVGLRVLRREDDGIELRIPGKRGTSGWRSAQDLEDARQVAEEKRLLYVALTRARDVLVLPSLPAALLPGLAKSYSPLFKHLNSAGLAESSASVHVRTINAADLPAPPPVEGPHRISLRAVLEGDDGALGASRVAWQGRERSTVVGGLVRPSGAAADAAQVELPSAALAARERARRIGNAAHAGIAARLRGRPATTLPGFSDDEQRRLGELIANFDRSPLAARLRSPAGDHEPLIEAPLAVRLKDGTLLDGQVDLAFVENGAWILVDYKYGRPQARDAARLETYQLQLRSYAQALTAASGLAVNEAWLFFLSEGEAHQVVIPA